MQHRVLLASLGLAILLCPVIARADLYKWQGPDGVWHFTNTNPTDNAAQPTLVATEQQESRMMHEDLTNGLPLGDSGATVRVIQRLDFRRPLPAYIPPESTPTNIGELMRDREKSATAISLFVLIDASNSKTGVRINPQGFIVKDSRGILYDNRHVAEPDLDLQDVPPGEVMRGWISYRLPPGEDFGTIRLRYDYGKASSLWAKP